MALDYYSFQDKTFTCRKCKWKGLGKETKQGETFDSGFEVHCPKCEKRFPGLILYPTSDDALKKGSPSNKIGAILTPDVSKKEEIQKSQYRESLVETVDYLIGLRHELFAKVLNIAMKGDLKEIDESFDEGDTYEFQLKHLKDSSDINVNKLIDLIEEIEKTADSLANLNKIDDSELKNER